MQQPTVTVFHLNDCGGFFVKVVKKLVTLTRLRSYQEGRLPPSSYQHPRGLHYHNVFRPLSDKITADVRTVKGTFPSTRGEIRREKQASVCVRENDSVL